MNPDFWHERWQADRIGFHQQRVSPMLAARWPTLDLAPGSRVFVPLCGKSLDMPWLAERGHRILGVELSQIAVDAFFRALDRKPAVHETHCGRHHVSGPYEVIVGDAFALDAATLADCAAVVDRAALIALPASMRLAYLRDLYARLPGKCTGLIITLEYPQLEKTGPPFSVDESEVRAGLDGDWKVDLLERRDILAHEPGFRAEGVTALATSSYRIERIS